MAPTSPSSSRVPVAKTWDPKEILQVIDEKLFTEQTPYFRLDVKAIKDRRKFSPSSAAPSTPERPSKQARVEETRAKCALTIWEGQGVSPPLLVQDTVGCIIRPQQDGNGARFAKIELDRPLRAYCQDLRSKSGRPPMAQRFSMQITLQADTMDTPWPPVHLNKIPEPTTKFITDGDNSKVRIPLLVTTYSRFPQCPSKEDEALLGLVVSQDGKQYKPRLNLQIDARWVEPDLQEDTYSRWREVKNKHAPSSPTMMRSSPPTPSEPEPDLSRLRIRTIWQMQHRKIQVSQHRFEGLVCPLCDGASMSDDSRQRTFANPNIYVLHLFSEHDLFKFKPTVKYKEGDPLIVNVKIAVDIKSTYETGPDGSKSAEGEYFHRLKGTKGVAETLVMRNFRNFFDLQEYLLNDENKNWKKPRLKERSGRLEYQTNSNTTTSRSDSAFDSSARATPAALADLTRPAKLVPDLPLPRRKKYPVPPAPDGVIFFSLRVKRPLTEGELLSESDDDIDDDWLLQKQEARIESFDDLTIDEKIFVKRHDRHMLKENVNTNLHYREALIRFCRINAQWLRGPRIRLQFAKKIAALQLEGVIKMPQIFECMAIIDDPAVGDQMNVDLLGEPVKEDLPKRAVGPMGRLYSRCAVCRGPIRTLADIVRCANPTCLNDCHVNCCDALFGIPDAATGERPATCHGCRAQKEGQSVRPMAEKSIGAVDTEASEGFLGQAGSPNGKRQDISHRTGSGAVKEDPVVIDSDAMDTMSLEALYPPAPDPLSLLPNGKRATTPRYKEHSLATSTPSPNSTNITQMTPLPAAGAYSRSSLHDANDFPVGRDMTRLGKGVGQGASLQGMFSPGSADGRMGSSSMSMSRAFSAGGRDATIHGMNDMIFDRSWRSVSSPHQPAVSGDPRVGSEMLASLSVSPRAASTRRPFGDLLSYDKN